MAVTRLEDAWAQQPHGPQEAVPLPQARLGKVLPDACRPLAPRLPAPARLGRCHSRTLAQRPRAGSESQGLGTRPAHECAYPMSSEPYRGIQDSRIPSFRCEGTDNSRECDYAPGRSGRGYADIQGSLLRPVMDHRLMQLLLHRPMSLPESFERTRSRSKSPGNGPCEVSLDPAIPMLRATSPVTSLSLDPAIPMLRATSPVTSQLRTF